MISRIHGLLETIDGGRAQVTLDVGLTYEVMLPAFAAARLGGSLDTAVTLHTIEFYESTSQGASMTPRVAGFMNTTDKAFFELFTTVKGIGPRKALRALTLDTATVANAIADRDVKMLQTMPEIGKRMAETIVATLHGKVDRFVSASAYGRQPPESGDETSGAPTPRGSASREALEVLMQLGETRQAAMQWIDQVLTRNPELDQSQQIIAEALRIKGAG